MVLVILIIYIYKYVNLSRNFNKKNNICTKCSITYLGTDSPSKASLKQKKKREAKKAKKLEGDNQESAQIPIVSSVEIKLTGDVEKDKKLKALKKVSFFVLNDS